jgi:hypothetical protein
MLANFLGVLPILTSPLCALDGFFKIGSHKLFAQAGFEPRSS